MYALGVDPGIYIVGEIEVGPCQYFAYQHWWLPNNSTLLPHVNEYLGDPEEQPYYLLVSILEEEQEAIRAFYESGRRELCPSSAGIFTALGQQSAI